MQGSGVPLQLRHVAGLFVILIAGLAGSTLLGLVEYCFARSQDEVGSAREIAARLIE